jgi:hypothetical protein
MPIAATPAAIFPINSLRGVVTGTLLSIIKWFKVKECLRDPVIFVHLWNESTLPRLRADAEMSNTGFDLCRIACLLRGKKINAHKIADSLGEIEFALNNIVVVDLNQKNICLVKFNDAVFAFAYKCPHAGGTLAERIY